MTISMAGIKKSWLKNLHIISNVQVLAIHDTQTTAMWTNMIDYIDHILPIWVKHTIHINKLVSSEERLSVAIEFITLDKHSAVTKVNTFRHIKEQL